MKYFSLVASISIFAMLQGCASLGGTPEEIVAKRAQARLDALVEGDFEKAYSYASPAYRASVPFNAHRTKFAGASGWTGANVYQVSCESESCDVKTQITYRLHKSKMENTRPMAERWIKIDGKWWIYHR